MMAAFRSLRARGLKSYLHAVWMRRILSRSIATLTKETIMINKRTAFALAFALVPVSAIAGVGPGAIVVQDPNLVAAVQAGGAQIYECVENSGRLVCKFRELTLWIDDRSGASGDSLSRLWPGTHA
jgi:hypothetical protein